MNIAIVQARLTSNRLPRKVFLNLGDYTVITLQYERLKKASSINKIIYAIPDSASNDDLAKYLQDKNIDYYRGSESNVLSRYLNLYKDLNPSCIFRLTADCPLVDPLLIDFCYAKHVQGRHDYTKLGTTFADGLGVEILSKKAMEFLQNSETTDFDKEHVTTHIKRNPEGFSINVIENERDDYDLRYTLDHVEDYLVIKKIYQNFSHSILEVTHTEMALWLRSNQTVINMNSDYSRNHG
jgi:spore coat polysaccharide biosynthesis protein SpsF (cytidylyltransferase family)